MVPGHLNCMCFAVAIIMMENHSCIMHENNLCTTKRRKLTDWHCRHWPIGTCVTCLPPVVSVGTVHYYA